MSPQASAPAPRARVATGVPLPMAPPARARPPATVSLPPATLAAHRPLPRSAEWERAARLAVALSWASLFYMAVEGGVGVWQGAAAGSIALVGWGLASFVEGIASAIIVWRFTGERRWSPSAELRAQRLVALQFFVLAPYVLVESVKTLIDGGHADVTVIGMALTATSVVLMPLLGRAKHRLAARLGSRATAGEGTQNVLCGVQAAAVLIGLAANAAVGAWWLDPVIGLLIAAIAVREGVLAWRGETCADCASPLALLSHGAEARAAPSCCAAEAQAACCEPSDKAGCCGAEATASGGCGCSACDNADVDGATSADAWASTEGVVGAETPARVDSPAAPDVRQLVRARYATAATRISAGGDDACCGAAAADLSCCGTATTCSVEHAVFGAALYGRAGDDARPDTAAEASAVAASLGCGVPTAVADLHEGETVLDLGSGAGADVLISARRVGLAGKAIGLDMTDEMLALARRNAAQAGVPNVEFVKGYIEQIPLDDGVVDVVISNCVLNLSGDKPGALGEAARVLRGGGRFAISDVIADEGMDEATRADMRQWTGCIAGALTRAQLERALQDAGLAEIEIRETHRVHAHAGAVIVRARKPLAA